MSESPPPATRFLSYWWVLLLLPICLLAGWLLGQTSGPKPQEPGAGPRPSVATVSARADWPPAGAPSPEAAVEPPAPAAESPELSRWTTLDDALAESRRNGKPVLLDFNAEWCGPCQRLRREVFDDGTRGRLVQTAVIPVSIVDRAREDGSNPGDIESLQQRYQVDAFPTLVVFSPATGRSEKTRGFGDADRTLAWITEAAKSVR